MPTVGSLFDGIGAFTLGFQQAGFEPRWSVEIDKDCRRVTEKHFPGVKQFDDVRQVGKHNLEVVDCIIGGWPCQDLSVAGKRAGLAGKRSGLFEEVVRIVGEMRPTWLVLENVPGLLSSFGGEDMAHVLDSLEQMRYIVDVEILDAQEFGVAQRRRRVFFVCQSVESFQRQTTPSSSLTKESP